MPSPGFRSPLLPLGLASPGTQAGLVSLLAPWMGGASTPTAPLVLGVRSCLAPWMGGACAVAGVIIPVPPTSGGGGGSLGRYFVHDRHNPKERRSDDEEILKFIRMWLAWYGNQDD